jgi:hypothetical protein
VDRIDRQNYCGEVYDFTIPGDHTLWADGVLVHNCEPCITADSGTMLSPQDAVLLGPPNPDCQGGDFCRCTLVWVLSDDPAAFAAV